MGRGGERVARVSHTCSLEPLSRIQVAEGIHFGKPPRMHCKDRARYTQRNDGYALRSHSYTRTRDGWLLHTTLRTRACRRTASLSLSLSLSLSYLLPHSLLSWTHHPPLPQPRVASLEDGETIHRTHARTHELIRILFATCTTGAGA